MPSLQIMNDHNVVKMTSARPETGQGCATIPENVCIEYQSIHIFAKGQVKVKLKLSACCRILYIVQCNGAS